MGWGWGWGWAETLGGLGGEVWTKETICNFEWMMMMMKRFGRRREVYQLWLGSPDFQGVQRGAGVRGCGGTGIGRKVLR